MNLIALETLTAYIYLEMQALQILVAYQIQIKGYNTYTVLAHKINRALIGCKTVYFRLYLTDLECFADVQSIDLKLPVITVHAVSNQYRVNTMSPSLSMLVVNVLVKIELTCISLLSGREYGAINHSSNPIGKAFFDLAYDACKAIGFSFPSQLFGLFPHVRQTI